MKRKIGLLVMILLIDDEIKKPIVFGLMSFRPFISLRR